MDAVKLLEDMKREFLRLLIRQDGWGKNEILAIYDIAQNHAIWKQIDNHDIRTEN